MAQNIQNMEVRAAKTSPRRNPRGEYHRDMGQTPFVLRMLSAIERFESNCLTASDYQRKAR